jgi:hypothetical protein
MFNTFWSSPVASGGSNTTVPLSARPRIVGPLSPRCAKTALPSAESPPTQWSGHPLGRSGGTGTPRAEVPTGNATVSRALPPSRLYTLPRAMAVSTSCFACALAWGAGSIVRLAARA